MNITTNPYTITFYKNDSDYISYQLDREVSEIFTIEYCNHRPNEYYNNTIHFTSNEIFDRKYLSTDYFIILNIYNQIIEIQRGSKVVNPILNKSAETKTQIIRYTLITNTLSFPNIRINTLSN